MESLVNLWWEALSHWLIEFTIGYSYVKESLVAAYEKAQVKP
jgi:hypothetical protein